MPPNQPAKPRGRPRGSTKKPKSNGISKPQASAPTSARRRRHSSDPDSEDPFADSQPDVEESMNVQDDGEEQVQGRVEEEEEQKIIPPELLTRILHEFFEKESTRISKDANKAVGKYMDVFVREAIARAAVEKESGFLEVEDLEKVAPQLLLDL